ncbi:MULTISPECIES: bifunctional transcriptional activator/DNA repair enzyme AdaA [Paenibacillus]|jgi:AraC family transcriptional regulator of adaptative response/methylated-DNA-[protein]-cysteine methyltransferase|uniref:bifunctional transcriptional activator/DNA repair enzyme AdaA n=1 Tax=Paenibacillus TaxID=44249 RepID=UPI00096FBA5C|nr:trifunctional transcriptional activator/DNA repair protein Ada/methylated-DNA--[protein]-cysteine S-methyltransferase [Paenibacillus odorifer]OMC68065.1 bifunctional transcriptional activator/DNA repair enzyme protein Ada [Paenibacillus odorifer]OMC75961.1 bifunctional transcriptional activator/DNA repair enzyme protein Ada [Paenibacillus odorifer]OMD97633.1 bifunctional transcriptional activator/DNA repair enzyme protein Ada [Paenibacillus odorifer]
MITNEQDIDKYYKMLVEKNSNYEGVFFVGVKTTGIMCRPTCPAKKPLKENCEFFATAKEALLASYRPCKRCQPLSNPTKMSPEVKLLVEAIESNPERKWTDKDFDELSISANTARRQFKKQFGMTFIEYARSRRLGLAFKHIRNGDSIINAQLESGYDSSNGFRDAFSRTMGTVPNHSKQIKVLYCTWIETILGSMLAISDEESLLLLEFVDRKGLENEIKRLRIRLNATILPEKVAVLHQIEEELKLYFTGELTEFTTPVRYLGSDFQQKVWNELRKIPLGQTASYKELAEKINNPSACRAVARANGTNQLSILVPCHRVINSNGELGGYGGGLARKEWLIKHESNRSLKQNNFI